MYDYQNNNYQKKPDDTKKDYEAETAVEFSPNEIYLDNKTSAVNTSDETDDKVGTTVGYIGIILGILSFFWMPMTFAILAIVMGLFGGWRKNFALGTTAIVIGASSLLVQIIYYFGYWY